jgi:hypothetical protein
MPDLKVGVIGTGFIAACGSLRHLGIEVGRCRPGATAWAGPCAFKYYETTAALIADPTTSCTHPSTRTPAQARCWRQAWCGKPLR